MPAGINPRSTISAGTTRVTMKSDEFCSIKTHIGVSLIPQWLQYAITSLIQSSIPAKAQTLLETSPFSALNNNPLCPFVAPKVAGVQPTQTGQVQKEFSHGVKELHSLRRTLMSTAAEGLTFSPGERRQSEEHYKPGKSITTKQENLTGVIQPVKVSIIRLCHKC